MSGTKLSSVLCSGLTVGRGYKESLSPSLQLPSLCRAGQEYSLMFEEPREEDRLLLMSTRSIHVVGGGKAQTCMPLFSRAAAEYAGRVHRSALQQLDGSNAKGRVPSTWLHLHGYVLLGQD